MKKRLTLLCAMEIAYIAAAVLFAAIAVMVSCNSCSTNHYFSVTAEDMSNPNIEYRDSISVTKPW